MAQDDKEVKTKVKVKKPSRFGFRAFINVKSWLAFDDVKGYGKIVSSLAKDVFKRKQPEHNETFAEAIKRLNLTETDLVAKAKQFLLLAAIYVGAAILAFGYLIYLFYTGHLLPTILVIVLIMIFLSCALREHFWYMQIKQRKLGCNFKDWTQFILKKNAPKKQV
jgi:intracellular multiplication protein IcmV